LTDQDLKELGVASLGHRRRSTSSTPFSRRHRRPATTSHCLPTCCRCPTMAATPRAV
jgi:hypothetical protein